MDSDLESLFGAAIASVRAKQKAERTAVIRKTAEPAAKSTQALYLDPENWDRVGGVALVHEETQTILGNFSEYIHKSVPNCRRLVREEAPISVTRSERVDGSWWLGKDRRPEPPRPWHEKRIGFLHLYLSKLGVHSPACEVVVFLSYGSLARVELALDTTFAQLEGASEQLVMLPQGTNVLEVMSSEGKVTLLQDMGKEA